MSRMIVTTPIGLLCVREEGGAICECLPAQEINAQRETASPLLLEAERQLDAYFRGELRAFDLPLLPRGTAFETAVWNALGGIAYGYTKSYGEIAALIGRPGASRAVGRACRRNPLLVFVPCHRVIGAGGKLTGYAAGLEAKKKLLALEGVLQCE